MPTDPIFTNTQVFTEFQFQELIENLNTALGILFATFTGYASLLLCLWTCLQARKERPLPLLLCAGKSDHKKKINADFITFLPHEAQFWDT